MIKNSEERVLNSIKATDEMFDEVNAGFATNDTLQSVYLAAIAVYLKDISLSLAVLADLEVTREVNKYDKNNDK